MKDAMDSNASHYLVLYDSGVRGQISSCSESFSFSWLYSIFSFTLSKIFTCKLVSHMQLKFKLQFCERS